LPLLLKVLSIERHSVSKVIRTRQQLRSFLPQNQISTKVRLTIHHSLQLINQYPSPSTDPNRKPEMALALTSFRALCGFRPLSSIASSLKHTSEFAALIP
ncbi:Mannose-6-phosphate isomerase, partial [Termitomyces sp. J132]